jgi:cytochrome c oxidase assembly protein subunit 15
MRGADARVLHRLAVLTAGATLVLLFIGGLVTSTGSGLAVPDWPLSFGQVLPPMVGGVLFEHGHRLAAAAVGCLTLALALWIVLRERRAAVRVLALVALFTVVLQGVLGGVTVLYRLPLGVSVAHACLAQVFFCVTVTLAVVTGRAWGAHTAGAGGVSSARPGLSLLAGATTGLVFVQVLLGALVRHMGAGLAIPDFPLAFGRVVPPLVTPHITVHFAHRAGAMVVAGAVLWTVVRALRDPRAPLLRSQAYLAGGLLGVQVGLGALTIWSHRAVVPTTLHLAVGAALLATCLALTLHASRLDAPLGTGRGRAGLAREATA